METKDWLELLIGAGVLGAFLKFLVSSGKIIQKIEGIASEILEMKSEFKEMKSDIKQIKTEVSHIGERLSHLEGAFEERGRNEILKLVEKQK